MSNAARYPADRDHVTRYEVRREREITRGFADKPLVEKFFALDRARLAALGYALDGPTYNGDRFSGRLTVHRIVSIHGKVCLSELVDVIDERVAFRLLNEVRLPRADKMAMTTEQFQRELDSIESIGR